MRHYCIVMVAACPFPRPSGTPVRILRMAEALGKLGHDVHVVTYHLGGAIDTDAFQLHRIRRVPTYTRTAPGPSYQKLFVLDPLLALRLRGVLRRVAPDVIHAHHVEGLMVSSMANRSFRAPIVFDVHTLLESELPYYSIGLLPRMKRRIGRYLDGALPARATRIIAVTDDIEDKLVSCHGVDAGRITVIPSGIESEHFNAETSAQGCGNRLGKTVMFAGNLSPFQGIDTLLDIFARVRAQRADTRLAIVTDDSFDAYAAHARRRGILDAIDLLPSCFDTLPEVLRSADVTVNPRVNCAGIPQKLLNYMAAGRPIVSFSGSGKYMTENEIGLVVDDGDTQGFADAVVTLLDDAALAARLGIQACDFATRNLGWDTVARKTEAVYHLCVGGGM